MPFCRRSERLNNQWLQPRKIPVCTAWVAFMPAKSKKKKKKRKPGHLSVALQNIFPPVSEFQLWNRFDVSPCFSTSCHIFPATATAAMFPGRLPKLLSRPHERETVACWVSTTGFRKIKAILVIFRQSTIISKSCNSGKISSQRDLRELNELVTWLRTLRPVSRKCEKSVFRDTFATYLCNGYVYCKCRHFHYQFFIAVFRFRAILCAMETQLVKKRRYKRGGEQ